MQVNKPMTQFWNKGWEYFKQVEEMMPNMSARGSHMFSLMNAAPPSELIKADKGVEGDVAGDYYPC